MMKYIYRLLITICGIFLISFGILPIGYSRVIFSNSSSKEIIIREPINLNKKLIDIDYLNQLEKINILIEVLNESKFGKKLVQLALEKNHSIQTDSGLGSLLEFGSVSYTDTKLIRRFSLDRPDIVEYQFLAKIILNENSSILDASLDLAHELTHFVHRESFDPYHERFQMVNFVRDSIEGLSGEVNAFKSECEVLKELSYKDFLSHHRCQKLYFNNEGEFNFDLAISYFYQMGDFYDQFQDKVKGQMGAFSKISRSHPFVYSAVHSVPYPLAMLWEYETITKSVCDNDKKRLALLINKIKKNEPSRAPAKEDEVIVTQSSKAYDSLKNLIQDKCSK